MHSKIFTVYDSAADRYLEPFFAPSVEFALREFRSAANTEGHQFAKFPADYTLFFIGTFAADNGKIIPLGPTSLGIAITLINSAFAGEVEA